ncbi:hypothetical protein JMM61_18960 [Rhodovulum sulfidophilum]|uniref:hypothetical protein n=1 Tax=Rhodovulum sulfidophilum TaxID=35806 RepID=UPI0019284555|nr:hypothetical protein [Rhodovulum sulfidophilum]MBL3587429.1 hypothetical protein [Rhodovulum sulfidophilum]
MRTLLCQVALCLSLATAAHAQAFGIEQGTAIDKLPVVEDVGDGYYLVEAPNPVSFFESYVVFATENAGACIVRGLGKTHERDGYGLAVRDDFENLQAALDEKYGKGEMHSALRRGAIWDELDEWVMAIRQNERYHQAEWRPEQETGVNEIILTVKALSSDDSYVVLQYRFANELACDDEIASKDRSGL